VPALEVLKTSRVERRTPVDTVKLTDQQSLRIADLPPDFRVVGMDRGAPFVRKPSGEMLRIHQNGRLTPATLAAKRRLAGRRDADHRDKGPIAAVSPYTEPMD
jgi:hypothetical protein